MRKAKLLHVILVISATVVWTTACGPAGDSTGERSGGGTGTADTADTADRQDEGAAADSSGGEVTTTAVAVAIEFTGILEGDQCKYTMKVDGADTEDVTLHLDPTEGPVAAKWTLVGGASKAWAILRKNDLDLCLNDLTEYHIKGVKGFEITAAGTTESTSGMTDCEGGTYPYDLRARIGDKFCGVDPRVIIAD